MENFKNTSLNEIKCPKCGEVISIDAVLTHQVEEKIKKDFAIEQKSKEAELEKEKRNLALKGQQLEEAIKSNEIEVNKKVAEKIASTKANLWKEALIEAEKNKASVVKMLEEQLKDKDQKLSEASKKELEIRKEKNRLEEDKRSFELEKQRQMDEERKNIAEEASKKATEDQQYIIAQLKKQLNDAIIAKDGLARKLEQGSQQLQGEVQELDIESFLKEHFIYDEIVPVPKGVSGADVLQKVISKNENPCGSILWESKHTKNWTDSWIPKLKEDQRNANADISVIVSDILPKDVNNVGLRNGIWIANRASVHGLAAALRNTLTQVAFAKLATESKDEKMELLFRYLTGPEFKQRVEAMVEIFSTMKIDLDKEKKVTQARWGKQEKQIEKIASITIGMHGNLRGLIGSSMGSIPALESGEELSKSEEITEEESNTNTENENPTDDEIDIQKIPF